MWLKLKEHGWQAQNPEFKPQYCQKNFFLINMTEGKLNYLIIFGLDVWLDQ
jgi:hypothetical protein